MFVIKSSYQKNLSMSPKHEKEIIMFKLNEIRVRADEMSN